MLKVRTSYLVKVQDVPEALTLLKRVRDTVWPILGWQGWLQQVLHGHIQQSLLVWSSEWDSLASWEAGMERMLACPEYQAWVRDWQKLEIYGEEREVFQLFEPRVNLDNTPGKIEVRSSYLVPLHHLDRAMALAEQDQKMNFELKEAVQDEVMLFGKAAQSAFVFASIADSLTAYDQGMSTLVVREDFPAWWKAWTEAAGLGGTREILRNI